jgi:hypothetical protein
MSGPVVAPQGTLEYVLASRLLNRAQPPFVSYSDRPDISIP